MHSIGVIGIGDVLDHVMIRGRLLKLDELFACDITSSELIASHREAFESGKPFEHIVLDGLFNPQLLSLIEEEFPASDASHWRKIRGRYETIYRSASGAELGPAAQIYFNLINSNAFVSYLSAITGIPDLIVDHSLFGGGLHETRAGGMFAVHLDFNYHRETMLANKLVFLTYLNRDWKPEYGGALELWDAERTQKVTEVMPLFGRSVLFRHSNQSFHGHPAALTPPPGRSRRSLGSYYYVNDLAKYHQFDRRSSLYLNELKKEPSLSQALQRMVAELRPMGFGAKLKYCAYGMTPPVLWAAAKVLRNSMRWAHDVPSRDQAQ
jgi:Rps23 Pro-64 3,4-dihydroxylase Tpa1-like proline 4-hydroxylase